jgi:uncharacterized protein (TIGR02145 family)
MKRLFFIVAIVIVFSCEKKEDKITDVDDNVYTSVTIGSQVWMAENLKTTKYNDGNEILGTGEAWAGTDTGAYCWYDNDVLTYKNVYGALYNWYAVNTGKLCPKGWHVPSDAEWTTLTTFLGGDLVAGGKLKEKGTVHWNSPNSGATNETGFTALPGGQFRAGQFNNIGHDGIWWSATTSDDSEILAWWRLMSAGTTAVIREDYSKRGGYSVRCLKD